MREAPGVLHPLNPWEVSEGPGPDLTHSVLGCAKPGHHPGPPPRAFSRGVGLELRPHPNLSPVLPNPCPSNRGFCLFLLLLFFAIGVLFYLPGVVSHIFLYFSKTSVSFLSLFYFLFFVIALLLLLLLFFFFFFCHTLWLVGSQFMGWRSGLSSCGWSNGSESLDCLC